MESVVKQSRKSKVGSLAELVLWMGQTIAFYDRGVCRYGELQDFVRNAAGELRL